MARRRSRKFNGVKRPLRWIYSGAWERDDEALDCAVNQWQVACGDPLGIQDPPRGDGGEFWHELVRGETDLDYSDLAAPTVTRIVGDVSVRSGWWFLRNPPAAGGSGHWELQPYLRMGICVVDEPDLPAWVPPDLWSADDGEGVRWLWRWHSSLADEYSLYDKLIGAYNSAGVGGPADKFRVYGNEIREHVDIKLNAKVSKNQSLIMCHSYRFYFPGFLVGLVDAPELEAQSDIVIGISHDLRTLVKS